MRNIALILMYNGAAYHGWQVQKTETSVAQTLERGLSMVCGEPIKVTGCGRTDAGVHAEHYVANFRTSSRIPVDRLPFAANTHIPEDIVVKAGFVLHVRHPEAQLAAVAPLLCAGITTYSPLRHWQVGPGSKVGIVGLGGLGHMGVKIARAMGATVTLFTTSPGKAADGLRLGAHAVCLSTDREPMKAHVGSLDFILNTVAAPHKLDAYLRLLKRDGTMTLVGLPAEPHPTWSIGTLITGRRQLAGSLIGGIRETQEMLDFCAQHGIVSDIEMIRMDEINTAYERMLKSDVKYRFVIDMATL